jgi:outer membrane protein assembly factor BamB
MSCCVGSSGCNPFRDSTTWDAACWRYALKHISGHGLDPSIETTERDQPTLDNDVQQKPLRLWPAATILVLAVGLIIYFYIRAGDDSNLANLPLMMGPVGTALLIVIWWIFGSGVPWKSRMLGLLVPVAAIGVTMVAAHPSMRQLIMFFGVPIPIILCTVWALFARKVSRTIRLRVVTLIACAAVVVCLALRFDGMSGNGVFSLAFRWSSTIDERAVAYLDSIRSADPVGVSLAEPLIPSATDSPEFRGLRRDGIVRQERIRTDWNGNPPKLLWKHPVGLGWSSFAVVGDFAFTQEQRRDNEVVVCYDAITGGQIWTYADSTRFSEAMGGDGPRATPTFHDGKIYALGANGTLNCLDARTGKRVWSASILGDGAVENVTWGMAGSPLVFDDTVVVNAGGSEGHGLLAYDRLTGKQVWSGGSDKAGYGSPQLAVLDGRRQVLIFDQFGLAGHDAQSGAELWKFAWPTKMSNNCLQPHVLNESEILTATMIVGTVRLKIQDEPNGWTAIEQWTSRYLKPNFNDFVVSDGHAYGLDQGILACIDLTDGGRAWKGGRYGYGQVLLMEEDNMLLVLTEKGEVVLVEASPNSHHEVARFQAIEGKTWNHPVVTNGRLFVRNSEEAACYDVALPTSPGNAPETAALPGDKLIVR